MNHSYPSLLRRGAQRGLLLLGLAGLLPVAQAQVSLAPVVTYPAIGSPQGIVSADFNGDGRPDLATANSTPNNLTASTVSVLLQSSTTRGTFLATTAYPSGGGFAVVLAAGDLNGDGRPDLAVIHESRNIIGILLNSATTPGTFAAAVSYPSGGTDSRGIAVADVNGDGRLDLVTGGSSTVSVLLQSSTTLGTFGSAISYSSGGSSTDEIAVNDLNGDGRPDIVTVNGTSGTVSVLLNSATAPGTFPVATTYVTGSNFSLRGLAVGDLNNDGRPDIVAGNSGNNLVSVLLNSATLPGTFGTATNYASNATFPLGIALGDLNGDGLADIVTENYIASNTVGILLNSAAAPGTFPTGPTGYNSGGAVPFHAVVRDLNGDGQADIAVTNYNSDNVGILLNTTVSVPTIGTISPSIGPVGTQVTITGTNLTGATAVSFNGTPASSFVVNSATSITAVVAAGTTTGLVSVTTPSGTATSATPFVVRVAPTTVADSYTTPQNVTLTGNVLTNDLGTNPVAILINRPTNGTLVLNPNGSFTYRPNAGYTGPDSFTYYACDPNMPLLCGNPATVSITVLRIAPVTVADSYTTPQNVTLTGNVLSNDLGTNPRAILITRPTNGTLVLNPDGTFTYRPNMGYTGPDSFTYYACDPALPLLCGNPATVSITVTRVAPITVTDSYTTPQGVTLTGNVLNNDIGTNPRAILINRPTNGTLVLNPDGSFRYTPNTGFAGADSFTYYACDPAMPLLCGNPATVSITVLRVAPVTVADAYTTPQNVTLTGNVLANDLGTNPRAILINRPTRGTLVLNPNGSFAYQPAAGFTGADSFTYYACDPNMPLLCGNPATVSITVVATPSLTATKPATTTSAARGAATTTTAPAAQELALTASPNPFRDELRLSFALPTAQAYSLAVYDAQGRLIQQLASGQAEAGQAQELTVPTHTYATGLYLVRLTTATGTQLIKLIKQ